MAGTQIPRELVVGRFQDLSQDRQGDRGVILPATTHVWYLPELLKESIGPPDRFHRAPSRARFQKVFTPFGKRVRYAAGIEIHPERVVRGYHRVNTLKRRKYGDIAYRRGTIWISRPELFAEDLPNPLPQLMTSSYTDFVDFKVIQKLRR